MNKPTTITKKKLYRKLRDIVDKAEAYSLGASFADVQRTLDYMVEYDLPGDPIQINDLKQVCQQYLNRYSDNEYTHLQIVLTELMSRYQ